MASTRDGRPQTMVDIPELDLDAELADLQPSPRRSRIRLRFSTPELLRSDSPSERTIVTKATRASECPSVLGSLSPRRQRSRLDPYEDRPIYPVISTPSEESIPSLSSDPRRYSHGARVSTTSGVSDFDIDHTFDSKQDRRQKAIAARAERVMETPAPNEISAFLSKFKMKTKLEDSIATGKLLFWISASVLTTIQVQLAQTYSDIPLSQFPYEFFISVAVVMLLNYGVANGWWPLIAPFVIYTFHNVYYLSLPDFYNLCDKLDEYTPDPTTRKYLTIFAFGICALRFAIFIEVIRIFCIRWFLYAVKTIIEITTRSHIPKMFNITLESTTTGSVVRDVNQTNSDYRLAESMSDTERQIAELRKRYKIKKMRNSNDVVDDALRRAEQGMDSNAHAASAETPRFRYSHGYTGSIDMSRYPDSSVRATYATSSPRSARTDGMESCMSTPRNHNYGNKPYRGSVWQTESIEAIIGHRSTRTSSTSLSSYNRPSTATARYNIPHEPDSENFQYATTLPEYMVVPGTSSSYNEYNVPNDKPVADIMDRKPVENMDADHLNGLTTDEDYTTYNDNTTNNDNTSNDNQHPTARSSRIRAAALLKQSTILRSSLSYTVQPKGSDESDYRNAEAS